MLYYIILYCIIIHYRILKVTLRSIHINCIIIEISILVMYSSNCSTTRYQYYSIIIIVLLDISINSNCIIIDNCLIT